MIVAADSLEIRLRFDLPGDEGPLWIQFHIGSPAGGLLITRGVPPECWEPGNKAGIALPEEAIPAATTALTTLSTLRFGLSCRPEELTLNQNLQVGGDSIPFRIRYDFDGSHGIIQIGQAATESDDNEWHTNPFVLPHEALDVLLLALGSVWDLAMGWRAYHFHGVFEEDVDL